MILAYRHLKGMSKYTKYKNVDSVQDLGAVAAGGGGSSGGGSRGSKEEYGSDDIDGIPPFTVASAAGAAIGAAAVCGIQAPPPWHSFDAPVSLQPSATRLLVAPSTRHPHADVP